MKKPISNTSTSYHAGLHRFAVFTSITTFFLIIAGGLVTSTDSGLAVPDWPLSYGQLMPPMVGGIFYEHGHRMVATFVGLLTTILALWLWRREERAWVRRLGYVALLAVISQGILGGITVLYLLPTWVSVSHATLAQSFFSLTIIIAIVTSRSWVEGYMPEKSTLPRARRLAVASVAVILMQLVLGALMRHTASGLAIPDFPTTYTHWLPPMDAAAIASLNEYRLTYYDLPPIELSQIWIHFAHRIGALLVLLVVGTTVWHMMRNYAERRLRETSIVVGSLLLVQFLLGALTVWTGKGVQIATSHVAAGALLLGMSVALTVYTYRFQHRTEEVEDSSLAAEPSAA